MIDEEKLGRISKEKLEQLGIKDNKFEVTLKFAEDEVFVIAAAQLQLPVVGLPGSELEAACREQVAFVPEGFADRRYKPDGLLVPRTEPDAFVHDPDEAVSQVEWLVREKGVRTICVHGDNPQAVAFTKAVRESLLARGATLKAFA